MWNGWLYGDIFEIAEACINEKMTIIGYCEDIVPKINTISGCEQNIGVCAEYDDGERIWCHYSGELLENLLDVNAELLKKQ
jgi:hypothetical protein